MRRRHTPLAAVPVLAAALFAASVAAAAPAEGRSVAAVESDQIDDWVTDRMAAHAIPGVAVAVVSNGEVTHLAGYGIADASHRPVTPDTPFLIGSTSKPFTATLVRQLVDGGHLSLDEPVLPYLGHLVDDVPAGFEQATVRHLLNHTGGLGRMVGLAGTVDIDGGGDALDRRVADLLDAPLSNRPGTFEYSNAGPQLLAAVTEQVTGEPFAHQLKERIFEPLGMDRSFATSGDPLLDEMATGHRRWFGGWRPADLPYDEAGAAMGYVGSTARDLARFVQAYLAGDQHLPATAAQIADEPTVATGWDIPGETSYGLGWSVGDIAGHRTISHAGSLAHITAHVIMAPQADVGLVVLTNASAFVTNSHEAQYDISLGLTRMLLGADPAPVDTNRALTLGMPAAAWTSVALLLVAAVRFLRRRSRSEHPGDDRKKWLRDVAVPGLAFAALGAGLIMATPLDAARHFAPDVGWALTVLAYGSILWALVRTSIKVRVTRRS